VWHRDVSAAFPHSLTYTSLAQNGEWHAALVSLPPDRDSEVESWLSVHTGLPTSQQVRRWSSVYPAVHAIDTAGQFVVAPSNTLFLHLHNADAAHTASEFEAWVGNDCGKIDLPTISSRLLIEVDLSKCSDSQTLSLRWDKQSVASIRRLAYAPSAWSPAVIASFRAIKDNATSAENMHQSGARVGFDRIRSGEWLLTAINYPAGITGALRWRSQAAIEWQSLLVVEPDGTGEATSVAEGVISKLNSVLRNLTVDVQLDFKAFGTYVSPGRSTPASEPSRPLGPDLRRRLIWVCVAAKAYRSPAGSHNLSDEALLKHFEHCALPRHLVPHGRTLRRAVLKSIAARPT
jgi:hypothetical protein